MNHSREPCFRRSTFGARKSAPCSAAALTTASSFSGLSVMPGMMGARSTPVLMPMRASSSIASSRLEGFGVTGSICFQRRSSRVATPKFT